MSNFFQYFHNVVCSNTVKYVGEYLGEILLFLKSNTMMKYIFAMQRGVHLWQVSGVNFGAKLTESNNAMQNDSFRSCGSETNATIACHLSIHCLPIPWRHMTQGFSADPRRMPFLNFYEPLHIDCSGCTICWNLKRYKQMYFGYIQLD